VSLKNLKQSRVLKPEMEKSVQGRIREVILCAMELGLSRKEDEANRRLVFNCTIQSYSIVGGKTMG